MRLASSTSSVGGEQRKPAQLVQEQLQRVGGGSGELVGLVAGDRRGPSAVVGELDAARLDLLVQRLELLVAQLERLGLLAELGEVDAAVLLAPREQRLELWPA